MLEEVKKPSAGVHDEIDSILACIEEARRRAEVAVPTFRADGAEKYLVDALRYAEEELAAAGKRLTQRTAFAIPRAS